MSEEQVTFEDWDPADDIEMKEDVIGILEVALEENDPEFLSLVMGNIARSKGMAQLVQEMGINQAELYELFSPDSNSHFFMLVKALDSLGFRLSIEQKRAS